MRFTEHEMTAAITGVSKVVLAAQHPDREHPDFDPEAAWNATPKIERYHLMTPLGEFILPALIALPDIDVPAGTRPDFTTEQVTTAVTETLTTEMERAGATLPADQQARLVYARTAMVLEALTHLPVRLDPDALLTTDDIESAAADFTVPDTLEGL